MSELLSGDATVAGGVVSSTHHVVRLKFCRLIFWPLHQHVIMHACETHLAM